MQIIIYSNNIVYAKRKGVHLLKKCWMVNIVEERVRHYEIEREGGGTWKECANECVCACPAAWCVQVPCLCGNASLACVPTILPDHAPGSPIYLPSALSLHQHSVSDSLAVRIVLRYLCFGYQCCVLCVCYHVTWNHYVYSWYGTATAHFENLSIQKGEDLWLLNSFKNNFLKFLILIHL